MSSSIIGWAHSRFGRLENDDLESLITGVAREAIQHAGVDAAEVDGIWVGNFNSGMVPDGFISSLVLQADDGLRWAPATRVENACASGSAAIFSALNAIDAGVCDVALVVGAEKMTSVSGQKVTEALGGASYIREEAANGMTFPSIFGKIAGDYFSRYGDHSVALATIAAKNHKNGVDNPWAQMRKDLGFEFCNEVSEKNPMISAPLRKTDCSLVSDGAAAMIIVNDRLLHRFSRAVSFRARSHINDLLPMSRRDSVAFEGPRRAWADCLTKAGCSISDLSFAEIHDCFTIAELLTYEAMGLASQGHGADVLREGTVFPGGKLPVNRSGGLKAKGHPVGATGVSMHVISAMQLCGEAGAMQIPNATLAGIFNMGGSAVANYVSLLEVAK